MKQRFSWMPLSAAVLAAAGLANSACAEPAEMTTVRVASGLVRPIFVTHAPGDLERIFIIEKQGRIRIMRLDGNVLLGTAFLDIDSLVGGGTSESDERGLLGLAFDADYANNGYFYVNYTNNSSDTVVARYTVSANPDIADSGSALILLTIDQPQTNHNGGWLGIGPDGYLYVAMGDGGGAGDDDAGHTAGVGNGQDITSNLLGKILRIDPSGDDFPADPNRNYAVPPSNPFVGVTGDDEIWAFGLRNPWRNSFDRLTGDLWIADVGQSAWEEVNFQPASSEGGENYGWRCWEGNHAYNQTGDCSLLPMTFPIHEYSHSLGCSITGGYVYRGCAIAGLEGTYFFGDYCSASIWSFNYDGAVITNFTNRTAELAPGGGLSINSLTSFGEDGYGEIYITDQTGGEVFKIVPACPTDLDGNGTTDLNDLSIQLVSFGLPGGPDDGDLDCSGTVDLADLSGLLTQFGLSCP